MTDANVEQVYYPVSAPVRDDADHERTAIRRAVDTPASDVVIVQVSRLEPWKGQHVLLEALTGLLVVRSVQRK
jgi:glycosyltransferase involved in cell wall biosynthesis